MPIELTSSHAADVMGVPVRRALPRPGGGRSAPGASSTTWDPLAVDRADPVDIAPHPHIGLQTVTWLVDGEVLHRDSLGSEQLDPARPAQPDDRRPRRGPLRGGDRPTAATCTACSCGSPSPSATRHGAAAFEHHADLPLVDAGLGHGDGARRATLGGGRSPARCDTDALRRRPHVRPGDARSPLRPDFEHALVVLDGAVRVDGDAGRARPPGLPRARAATRSRSTRPNRPGRCCSGGVPFEDPGPMWWNFVARTTTRSIRRTQSGARAAIGSGTPDHRGRRWPAPTHPGAERPSRPQRRSAARQATLITGIVTATVMAGNDTAGSEIDTAGVVTAGNDTAGTVTETAGVVTAGNDTAGTETLGTETLGTVAPGKETAGVVTAGVLTDGTETVGVPTEAPTPTRPAWLTAGTDAGPRPPEPRPPTRRGPGPTPRHPGRAPRRAGAPTPCGPRR